MPPGMVFRQQGTPDWMILFCPVGTSVRINGVLLGAREESICVFPPGCEQFYGNPEQIWSHSWIHVCGFAVDELMKKYAVPVNGLLPLSQQSFLRHLDYMAAEFSHRRESSWIVCRNTLEHLLLEMADTTGKEPVIPERMIKLREYMEKNYLKNLKLKDLSRVGAISVPLISLEFKKYFKTSPMAYLQSIRLRHSVYYLSDLNLSIAEVSRRSGFADPFYFSRQFRRKYGISPQGYRKKNLNFL